MNFSPTAWPYSGSIIYSDRGMSSYYLGWYPAYGYPLSVSRMCLVFPFSDECKVSEAVPYSAVLMLVVGATADTVGTETYISVNPLLREPYTPTWTNYSPGSSWSSPGAAGEGSDISANSTEVVVDTSDGVLSGDVIELDLTGYSWKELSKIRVSGWDQSDEGAGEWEALSVSSVTLVVEEQSYRGIRKSRKQFRTLLFPHVGLAGSVRGTVHEVIAEVSGIAGTSASAAAVYSVLSSILATADTFSSLSSAFHVEAVAQAAADVLGNVSTVAGVSSSLSGTAITSGFGNLLKALHGAVEGNAITDLQARAVAAFVLAASRTWNVPEIGTVWNVLASHDTWTLSEFRAIWSIIESQNT